MKGSRPNLKIADFLSLQYIYIYIYIFTHTLGLHTINVTEYDVHALHKLYAVLKCIIMLIKTH